MTNKVRAEERRQSAGDGVNGSSFGARRRKLPWSDIATALSPGPTESFFEERSRAGKTNLYRLIPKKRAADVARAGYEGIKRGSAAVIPGAISKVLVSPENSRRDRSPRQ